MDTIGMRIKHLRREKGDSMAVLGKAIGTDSANISNWENDKRIPGGKFIVALSEYFNTSTDWLLKGQDSISNKSNATLFLSQSCELNSRIAELDDQEQHFIHAFADFYTSYVKKRKAVQQTQFVILPLIKRDFHSPEIMSEDNIVAYIPIPSILAKQGDFIFSDSYNHDQPNGNENIKFSIIKKQKQASVGQLVLIGNANKLTLQRLIKKQEKLCLTDIDTNEEMVYFNRNKMNIYGIVTGIYKAETIHSP